MKKKRYNLKSLFLLFFIIIVGCSFENQVLMTIDKDTYTVADARENIHFAITDDSLQRANKVDDFVNRMLVVREARERGYDEDPVVNAAYETHQKDLISRGYYEARVVDKVKITQAEVRKTYSKVIDQYHLAQIVADQESLAQHIHDELKKGVPFESLLHFSLDTLSQNGDIGVFSAMSLPPEIMTQIEKMKEGETTDVIEFGNYYYVFKLVEHKKTDTPKFENVKESIHNNLLREKVADKSQKFVRKIIDEAKIEYNQEGLDVLTKPDSLVTEEDLNKWVVKKHDTSYVYVRTIRDAVAYQHRQSSIQPQALIERVLVPDLIYDQALKVGFDKSGKMKRQLRSTLNALIYQKFYSDEVLEKVVVDSLVVVDYYRKNKDQYKDKKFGEVYNIVKTELRDEKINMLRNEIFENLRSKHDVEINQLVLGQLLKEEK